MELSNSNLETALSMLGGRLHIKNAPSEGFRMILISMYEQLGYDDVAERL